MKFEPNRLKELFSYSFRHMLLSCNMTEVHNEVLNDIKNIYVDHFFATIGKMRMAVLDLNKEYVNNP